MNLSSIDITRSENLTNIHVGLTLEIDKLKITGIYSLFGSLGFLSKQLGNETFNVEITNATLNPKMELNIG